MGIRYREEGYGWTRCIETVKDAKDAAYEHSGVAKVHSLASFDPNESKEEQRLHHLIVIRENTALLACLDAIEALARADVDVDGDDMRGQR